MADSAVPSGGTDASTAAPVPEAVVTPASPPVKQLLTLDIGDGAVPLGALAAPPAGSSNRSREGTPDFSSAAYRESLATALRWDPERQEPYLQLPSYPELRITPFRPGIEDNIVTLFNHPSVGKRLYRLPYPMKRPFAEKWVHDDLHRHVTFLTAFNAGLGELPTDKDEAAATPLEPHHDVIILGLPFKSLWDTRAGRIIGDVGMSPDTTPLTEGGPARTEDQVLASPLSSQTWHLGYVLDPAAEGRGIMSELVGVVLESWVRPIMRIEHVVAIVEDNNQGSIRVVLKNGFRHTKNVVTDWPEDKGGGQRFSGHYVWTRGSDGSDDERVMRNLRNRRCAMDLELDTEDSDTDSVSAYAPTPSGLLTPGGDARMQSPARG